MFAAVPDRWTLLGAGIIIAGGLYTAHRERVCAVVTVVPGRTLTLPQLTDHLGRRGLGKELWPEHLIVLEELPRSSGGKLAKGELRRLAEDRLAGAAD